MDVLRAILAQLAVDAAPVMVQSIRCHLVLRRWLRRNSLQLVASDERNLFRGPFFFGTASSDKVLRIAVKDVEGVIRKGFLCCREHGRGFSGRHHLDVHWDD